MKRCKRTGLILLLAVVLVMAGCSSKDKDDVSSIPSDNNMVDNAQSAMDNLESRADNAIDDMQSDFERNEDSMESEWDETTQSIPSVNESFSEDLESKTANLPAFDSIQNVSVDRASINRLPNNTIAWGPGKDVDDVNRPISCLSLQSQYGPLGAQFIATPTAQKTIYLTFDEGYENGYTPQILDVLKSKHCPATFFVTTPYVTSNPALLSRMIDEGHAIGNHTNRHPSMPSVSLERAQDEIQSLHQQISDRFGYEMHLFRPPMGEFSERTLALTQQLGYQSIFWSFAYADWDPNNQPSPEKALPKMTSAAHDGAIYLLHAVSKTNADVLGTLIDALRTEGYQFALLP